MREVLLNLVRAPHPPSAPSPRHRGEGLSRGKRRQRLNDVVELTEELNAVLASHSR